MQKLRTRLWTGRFLIGLVLVMNVQSALVFLYDPAKFAPAFELNGLPGLSAVRGMAVLFLMWNVPYLVALIDPVKYRVSLFEAILMQSIGLVGESFIYWALPVEHITLRGSIWRFILFDASGLIALLIAAWITKTWKGVKPFQV